MTRSITASVGVLLLSSAGVLAQAQQLPSRAGSPGPQAEEVSQANARRAKKPGGFGKTAFPAARKNGPGPEIGQAPAQPFWAFQRPVAWPVPEVQDRRWPVTNIDRFILARLEQEGLAPAPDADPLTLLRRITFDLTGLPPRPEEIDAFVCDTSPDAIQKVVDRLLASPHFGERWGRHWLDVARYADSSGGGRAIIFQDAWRYRDYCVQSFNRDKPYSQFISEQIAGDLLPYDTPEERSDQLIATGFLVLGPTNYELQDKELLRMEVVDEQIDTMGRAVLGMTLGCARCHDHKFDPLPTTDYYALAGIFRSTKTLVPGNVSGFVEQPLPVSEPHAQALKQHAEALQAVQNRIQRAQASLDKLQGQLELDKSELPGIVLDNTEAKIVGSWKGSAAVRHFLGKGYIHDENRDKGRKAVIYEPDLPAAGVYEVRVSYAPGNNRARSVPVIIRHAEGEETLRLDQRQPPEFDNLFQALGQFRFAAGRGASVTISNTGTGAHVIADAVQFIPLDAPRRNPVSSRNRVSDDRVSERSKLRARIAQARTKLRQLEAELDELKKGAPVPQPMAMSVKDEDEPGDFRVCIRGDVHSLGQQVPRGFLSVVPAGAPDQISPNQSGRIELARWLTSPLNPLTARVMTNRIWQHLFGTGIVRTSDNFGTMGEAPSHPKLLDWLAVRFMEQGWSVKKMIRQIVLSRVYQQSTLEAASQKPVFFEKPGFSVHPRPAKQAVDPENSLLSRMNRRRLDAEALRDAMLMVSGQLEPKQGGPAMRSSTKSEFDYQYDSRRRSVYIPIFRNSLHGMLDVFDFADPNLVTGRRNTSTLPTQALYLMNSAFVMDQSRHAAEALLAVPDLDDSDRIELAYFRALGRPPMARERALALGYLSNANHPNAATRVDAWAGVYQALFACIDFRYLY